MADKEDPYDLYQVGRSRDMQGMRDLRPPAAPAISRRGGNPMAPIVAARKAAEKRVLPTTTGDYGTENYGTQVAGPALKKAAAPAYGADEGPMTAPVQGYSAGAQDRSSLTEAERTKLYSNIQDQLNKLGPLNMGSKRQLAGNLLGLQRQLTADRAGQLSDADKQVNAIADSNATRGQGADQFNAEVNEKGLSRKAASRAAAAKLAFENDPNALGNRLKIADAKTRAAQADVAIQNARNSRSDASTSARVAGYMKGDPNLKYEDALRQAREAEALDQARLGSEEGNDQSRLGDASISQTIGGIINQPDSFLRRGEGGGSFVPFREQTVDPTNVNLDDVQVGDRQGALGFRDKFQEGILGRPRPQEVYVTDENGNKAFGDVPSDQALALKEYLRRKRENKGQ